MNKLCRINNFFIAFLQINLFLTWLNKTKLFYNLNYYYEKSISFIKDCIIFAASSFAAPQPKKHHHWHHSQTSQAMHKPMHKTMKHDDHMKK